MPARLAVLAISVVAVASLSGVALGNYATTVKQPDIYSSQIDDVTAEDGSSGGMADAAYAADVADLAPDHMPVCRRGCGPTLSERQSAVYFDDGYTQLDRVYKEEERDYAPAAVDEPLAEPRAASIGVPPPNLTLASPAAPCSTANDAGCANISPARLN